VINCVGPYRFHGEKVIRECIEARTHHLDVSGEPEFLESMQLKYDQAAREKQVYIVGSCGFDSLPADLGVLYTRQQAAFDVEQVESFLTFENRDKSIPTGFNYATWESAVYGFSTIKQLKNIRKQLFTTQPPNKSSANKLPKRVGLFGYFYDKLTNAYCMEFLGSDKSVVQRTNYHYLNEKNSSSNKKKFIQYQPYFTVPSFYYTLMMIVFGSIFQFLAKYEFGRRLLLTHYRFFTCGLARKENDVKLDPERMEANISFKMQFRGYGFNSNNNDSNDDSSSSDTTTQMRKTKAANKQHRIITEVVGPEPGYVATSKIVINSSLVLLKESDRLPAGGGVLTPAVAFGETSIIDRLRNAGLKFHVVYSEDQNQNLNHQQQHQLNH
jgi:hypothetical protein